MTYSRNWDFTVPHSTVIYNWYGLPFSFSLLHNIRVPSCYKEIKPYSITVGFLWASFVTTLTLNITNKVIIYSQIIKALFGHVPNTCVKSREKEGTPGGEGLGCPLSCVYHDVGSGS